MSSCNLWYYVPTPGLNAILVYTLSNLCSWQRVDCVLLGVKFKHCGIPLESSCINYLSCNSWHIIYHIFVANMCYSAREFFIPVVLHKVGQGNCKIETQNELTLMSNSSVPLGSCSCDKVPQDSQRTKYGPKNQEGIRVYMQKKGYPSVLWYQAEQK